MSDTQGRAWICSVCGYVHYGERPPECCPVCGATQDLFEVYQEAPPPIAQPSPQQWRCLNCGYLEVDTATPSSCPICGADANRFEPHPPDGSVAPRQPATSKVVILGAGIAGVSAAEALRKHAPEADITLLSKENLLPYYRLNLTRYLAGDVAAGQLPLHEEGWYREQRIALRLSAEVRAIDLRGKQAALRDGSRLSFDKLIIATGSHPFVPAFPGVSLEHVLSLRTKSDADAILEACLPGSACVCIGGGLLGLETAGALARRGALVTVLEGYGWLLPRQLNQRAGELLKRHIEAQGIKIRLRADTRELAGDEHVSGVQLKDGDLVPADAVVIATGVRCNSYLARVAGLKTNIGIIVDNALQTSHPDVLAAGDAAEHRGVAYGIWGPSQIQGTVAGMNAAGQQAEFSGMPRSNMLKVLNYNLFSIGKITVEDASYSVVDDEIDGNYYCFIFHDAHLAGAMLLGDTTLSAGIKKVAEHNLDCAKILRRRPAAADILQFIGEVQEQ